MEARHLDDRTGEAHRRGEGAAPSDVGRVAVDHAFAVDAPGCRVGIRRLKNTAISAMTARTDRAALRPSRRAVSFSLTISSAVCGGTSALSSAVFRSLSDTNGMPAASSTCALEETFSGILGLSLMPLKNDELNAEMSTAPASAVPIDAPRLVNVFCRPPTSPLCSSGTDDTVTLPSCDANAPTPSPASSIGQVT